jgi:hypothetical protein
MLVREPAALVGRYYPERAGQVLSDDLGPWLANEYTAVRGEKAPRPAS